MKHLQACAAMLLLLAATPSAAQETDGLHFRVDFQEGFGGWKTRLFLEGEPVYGGAPVTDPIVSLCGSVDLVGRSTIVEMRLFVFEAGIDTTFSIDLSAGEFLGLSIIPEEDGTKQLSVLQSSRPFGYD